MNTSVLAFPWWRLGYLLLLLLPAWWIVYRWAGQGTTLIVALARMALQLLALGYILVFLFNWDSPLALLSALSVMTVVSSWIALRPVHAFRFKLWPTTAVAVLIGALIPLFVATQLVIGVKPWYLPRYVIPLAGMCFSQAMNGISLASDRLLRELESGQAWESARRYALRTALIPITNQLMAVGLVSIPGVITGQVLAGTSPLLAVRYQMIIMSMVLTTIVFAVSVFLILNKQRFISLATLHQQHSE